MNPIIGLIHPIIIYIIQLNDMGNSGSIAISVSWFLGGSRRQGAVPRLSPVGGGGGASAVPIPEGPLVFEGWR